MLEVWDGRLGGGKSYCAVLRMAAAVGRGCRVWTNVTLDPQGFKLLCYARHRYVLHPEQLRVLTADEVAGAWVDVPWGDVHRRTLVVVDEAQQFFGAKARLQAGFFAHLTESRKACVDWVFIAPDRDLISKQVRLLCQYFVSHRDVAKVTGAYGLGALGGFLVVRKDYDGDLVFSRRVIPKRNEVYRAYSTLGLQRTEEKRRCAPLPRVKLTIRERFNLARDAAAFVRGNPIRRHDQ